MVPGKEGLSLGPSAQLFSFSTRSVPTASKLRACPHCGESILSDTSLTRLKRSCEVDRRDDHRSCSAEIRSGRLRAVSGAYLTESKQPIFRPGSVSFLNGDDTATNGCLPAAVSVNTELRTVDGSDWREWDSYATRPPFHPVSSHCFLPSRRSKRWRDRPPARFPRTLEAFL